MCPNSNPYNIICKRGTDPFIIADKKAREHITLGVFIFADGTTAKHFHLIGSTENNPSNDQTVHRAFVWHKQKTVG
jgi:hypothetical protein